MKTRELYVAAAPELHFGAGTTFAYEDYMPIIEGTTFKENVDLLERKAIKPLYGALRPLVGKKTGEGSVQLELFGAITGTGGSYPIISSEALTANFFMYDEPDLDGGGIVKTVGGLYELVPAGGGATGEYTLYTLPQVCAEDDSVSIGAVRGACGGVVDPQSITYNGALVESVKLNFPTAEIATITYDFKAAEWAEGGIVQFPQEAYDVGIDYPAPFVGKSMNVNMVRIGSITPTNLAGVRDLEVSLSKTIVDRETIVGVGITAKKTVDVEVKATFTVDTDDDNVYKWLNSMVNVDEYFSFFTSVAGGAYEVVVYLPKVSITAASLEDDNGISVTKVELMAYADTNQVELIPPARIGIKAY